MAASKVTRQVALELLVAAAGMLFLGAGLRQWSAIAWSGQMAGSKSPVRYGTIVRLPREVADLPLQVRWIVVTQGGPTSLICSELGSHVNSAASDPVGVWSLGPDHDELVVCSTNEAAAPVRQTFEIGDQVQNAVLSNLEGFLVADRSGRVIYGSYDRAALAGGLVALTEIN